jgi:hypothetical protein
MMKKSRRRSALLICVAMVDPPEQDLTGFLETCQVLLGNLTPVGALKC